MSLLSVECQDSYSLKGGMTMNVEKYDILQGWKDEALGLEHTTK